MSPLMGKVSAYRLGDLVIPKDQATDSHAWVCPFSGTIHESKKSYLLHLRAQRLEIHRRIHNANFDKTCIELWELPDIESICEWISNNPKVMLAALRRAEYRISKLEKIDLDSFWFEIDLNVQFHQNVSNSHSCPKLGVTNWGREDGLPTGYPGWHGRINSNISHDVFDSDALKLLGIHTGTGGGGRHRSGSGMSHGYDVKLFAADWPGLTKNRLIQKMSS